MTGEAPPGPVKGGGSRVRHLARWSCLLGVVWCGVAVVVMTGRCVLPGTRQGGALAAMCKTIQQAPRIRIPGLHPPG